MIVLRPKERGRKQGAIYRSATSDRATVRCWNSQRQARLQLSSPSQHSAVGGSEEAQLLFPPQEKVPFFFSECDVPHMSSTSATSIVLQLGQNIK